MKYTIFTSSLLAMVATSSSAFANAPIPQKFWCTNSSQTFIATGPESSVPAFLKNLKIFNQRALGDSTVDFKILSFKEVGLKDPQSDKSSRSLLVFISYKDVITEQISTDETETLFCDVKGL